MHVQLKFVTTQQSITTLNATQISELKTRKTLVYLLTFWFARNVLGCSVVRVGLGQVLATNRNQSLVLRWWLLPI